MVAVMLPLGLFGQWEIREAVNYSLKDGLSDRAILDMVQDRDGFIWVATNNGLNRFDGYKFQVFDNNEDSEFQIDQSRIHDIELLSDGRLALLNEDNLGSLEIFDPQSFTSEKIELNEKRGLEGRPTAVCLEANGAVYVLSLTQNDYLIHRLNEYAQFEKISQFSSTSQPNDGGGISIIRGGSGFFWVLDEKNGLFKIAENGTQKGQWPIEKLQQLTGGKGVDYQTEILFEDTQGKLWLSLPLRKGLLTLPPGSDVFSYPTGLPQSETYFRIWEDHLGNVSVGSFDSYWKIKNLYQVKKDGSVHLLDNLVEIESTISSILKPQNENILFLGTYVGIFKVGLINKNTKWLLADRQLEDNQWDDGISIRGITGDENGKIYISRELSAWYQTTDELPPTEEIILRRKDGTVVNLWCCSNVVFHDGLLWGGSCENDRDGLLHRYDPLTKLTRTFKLESKTIRHMILSQNKQLILVTGAKGSESKLLFFDPETEQSTWYRNADGSNPMGDREPQFVLEDRNGDLWLGTVEGLIHVKLGEQTSKLYLRTNSSLSNDDITCIHETPTGQLLVGTHGGLNVFDQNNESFKNYSIDDGMSNNIVACILPDGAGDFWITTFYGISHLDWEKKLFSTFYKEKGLTFNEFNRQAFFRDKKGKFYFGTINGINVFENEELKKAPFDKMKPVWTGMSIYQNGSKKTEIRAGLNSLKNLSLAHDEDLVRFEFTLPVFENSTGNRFATKLEGRDSSWQYQGSKNFYELNNPSSGKYTLRVKAVPSNGMWNPHELTINLNVAQAYYETWWFIIGLPLLFFSIAYAVARWYISQIKKREEEQTKVNKKFAELELQALQSQMNPHFVFNSLGAIQYFIQNNDREAADEYLAKFAKLMRLFLESSKNKYIPLDEEIKLLSLYVELEQMRFEDKFDWEIKVDEELDSHSREIPSILIQPFVENAINHGLFNKAAKGFLRIAFSENANEKLHCVIEDNGIGRTRAEALKKQSARNYKSRGMQIVEERLEVLQEVEEVEIKVNVTDLSPGAEDPGTRVTIEIQDFN